MRSDFLLRRLWPLDEVFEDTLRTHVYRLAVQDRGEPKKNRTTSSPFAVKVTGFLLVEGENTSPAGASSPYFSPLPTATTTTPKWWTGEFEGGGAPLILINEICRHPRASVSTCSGSGANFESARNEPSCDPAPPFAPDRRRTPDSRAPHLRTMPRRAGARPASPLIPTCEIRAASTDPDR